MIWIMRHGEAASGGDDWSRQLTSRGERQAAVAGLALRRLDAGIEACLTSPRVRAVDTARLICEPLGLEPEIEESLAGDGFDAMALAAGYGTVLLVGHEPDCSAAIHSLTGARARLRKGGLAAIDQDKVELLLDPTAAAAIAEPR